MDVKYFNNLTGIEISNPNFEIDKNISILLPYNYVAIKFTGLNVNYDGVSCEQVICNSIRNRLIRYFKDI